MGHVRRVLLRQKVWAQKAKSMNRKRNAIGVLCTLFLLAAPSQALNDGDLQRAILDARALGDVGASVKTDGTTAIVSTYLTTRDNVSTCKAKGVLVAKTLFDRVKTLALVRCTFFVPNSTKQYITVEVGEGAIKSYAAGNTTMPKLIASIPYQDTRGASEAIGSSSAQSASSAAGSSRSLRGLVPLTGNVQIGDRRAQISYMEGLQAQGINVASAILEFNQEQASIETGDLKGYTKHFNNCSSLIESYNRQVNDRAQSASSSSPVKPGRFIGERTTLWNRLNELKRGSSFNPKFQARFDSIEDMVGNPSISTDTLRSMIQNLFSEMR